MFVSLMAETTNKLNHNKSNQMLDFSEKVKPRNTLGRTSQNRIENQQTQLISLFFHTPPAPKLCQQWFRRTTFSFMGLSHRSVAEASSWDKESLWKQLLNKNEIWTLFTWPQTQHQYDKRKICGVGYLNFRPRASWRGAKYNDKVAEKSLKAEFWPLMMKVHIARASRKEVIETGEDNKRNSFTTEWYLSIHLQHCQNASKGCCYICPFSLHKEHFLRGWTFSLSASWVVALYKFLGVERLESYFGKRKCWKAFITTYHFQCGRSIYEIILICTTVVDESEEWSSQ